MKPLLRTITTVLITAISPSYGHNWNAICNDICKKQKKLLNESEYQIADGYKKNRKQFAFYFKDLSHETDTLYFFEHFQYENISYSTTFWANINRIYFSSFHLFSYMGNPINKISDEQLDNSSYYINISKKWDTISFKDLDTDNPNLNNVSFIMLTRIILYKDRKCKIDCRKITRTIALGESMGNIMSLKRNGLQDGGTYGPVDNLTLSYDGNRLTSVKDRVTDPTYKNAWNFDDGADSAQEYEYDENGNVTKDLNKSILSIEYNPLNLPFKIKFSNGNSIIYTYSADGGKLRAEYTTATPATTKRIDYFSNIILEDGKLQQINFEGGYATYVGSLWAYHYFIKDHLGNNRMVVHPSGLNRQPQVNNYYPYGGLMANSTNQDQQRYKYNGKELDRMHGLDWYDFGARWMDAALGRWHSIDPLCEKYYDVSPYAYCMDNPINRIDPDGRDTYLYARQLNAFLPMSLGVHTFIVVNILGKEPQYFSYGPSGKYLGTLTRTYYKDDIDIYTHADKTLQYEAIKITPPEGMSEMEFDNNVIKAANSFYEDSNVRYDILSPSESLDTGNCNSSTSTLLNKAGISKEKIDEIKENIPGNSYGFGDIKPWTKEEKDKLEKND